MTNSNPHLTGLALVTLAILAAIGAVGGLYQWEKSKRASTEVAVETPSPTPALAAEPPASPTPAPSATATPGSNTGTTTPPSGDVSFARDVTPILKARCFSCHSSVTLGGLSLASYQQAMTTGKHTPVVVPGDPASSLLYLVLKGPASGVAPMPPGQGLPSSDIETIGQWITQGAADN